jgi:hypothetical protein
MVSDVKRPGTTPPLGPSRIATLDDYLTSLQMIAESGLPADMLKARYRSARKEFESDVLMTGRDIPRLASAEMRALIAIARAEVNESGRAAPSDKGIARRLAAALSDAARARNDWLKAGTEVRVTQLDDAGGLIIHEKYITARRSGVAGVIQGYFPSHGGDVWAVKHADGAIAAYSVSEMKPAREPQPTRRGGFTG